MTAPGVRTGGDAVRLRRRRRRPAARLGHGPVPRAARRRRALRRPVAAAGPGPRPVRDVPRRPRPRARRADRRARRARRGPLLRAVPRDHRRPDHAGHLAPVRHRPPRRRIYVLDGGVITERGSHDDLVAAGGTYAEMYRLQAARFAQTVPTTPARSDPAAGADGGPAPVAAAPGPAGRDPVLRRLPRRARLDDRWSPPCSCSAPSPAPATRSATGCSPTARSAATRRRSTRGRRGRRRPARPRLGADRRSARPRRWRCPTGSPSTGPGG